MIKCKNACPQGKYDGMCCVQCPNKDNCSLFCQSAYDYENCPDAINEETALADFTSQHMATIQRIADLCSQKKQIEAQEKEMKDKLKESMEQFGITKFENDIIKMTYVKQGERTTLDSTRLKKELPDVAEKYSKKSITSAYVKVEVKG